MGVFSGVKGREDGGGLHGVKCGEDSGVRDVETIINAPYCLSDSICLCKLACKPT